jgi:hypothetical protein
MAHDGADREADAAGGGDVSGFDVSAAPAVVCNAPCRCRQGALHTTWVVTRSEQGRVRLYRVTEKERFEVRRLTRAYRDWQRARAALVKLSAELLRRLDEQAEGRLQPWPACAGTADRPAVNKEAEDGPSRH